MWARNRRALPLIIEEGGLAALPLTINVRKGLRRLTALPITTNAGGYYCSHWHQCRGLCLQLLAPMVRVIIPAIDVDAEGYYCIHSHQCTGLLLWPCTPIKMGLLLRPLTPVLGLSTTVLGLILQPLTWILAVIIAADNTGLYFTSTFSSICVKNTAGPKFWMDCLTQQHTSIQILTTNLMGWKNGYINIGTLKHIVNLEKRFLI